MISRIGVFHSSSFPGNFGGSGCCLWVHGEGSSYWLHGSMVGERIFFVNFM